MEENRLRIRNWKTFQHYSYRKPPWIKLYRELLDDKEWHALSGESAKGLIMLWLIASEADGYLPDSATLAFRLRISENRVIALLSDCCHFFEGDASNMLAECYQHATPEKSRDRVREEKISPPKEAAPKNGAGEKEPSSEFKTFWENYPRCEGKKAARIVWERKKLNPFLGEILSGLSVWRARREPQYMPYAQGWLNQEAWKETPLLNRNGSKPFADAAVGHYEGGTGEHASPERVQEVLAMIERQRAQKNPQ
jgi:hypothetical protein